MKVIVTESQNNKFVDYIEKKLNEEFLSQYPICRITVKLDYDDEFSVVVYDVLIYFKGSSFDELNRESVVVIKTKVLNYLNKLFESSGFEFFVWTLIEEC